MTHAAIVSRSRDVSHQIHRSHRLVRETCRLLAQMDELADEMQVAVAGSRRLRHRSRCLAPHPISGGADDSVLVMEVLAEGTAVCADCLAKKTGIPRVEIPSVIARIGKTIRVQTPDVACVICLTIRTVYRVG